MITTPSAPLRRAARGRRARACAGCRFQPEGIRRVAAHIAGYRVVGHVEAGLVESVDDGEIDLASPFFFGLVGGGFQPHDDLEVERRAAEILKEDARLPGLRILAVKIIDDLVEQFHRLFDVASGSLVDQSDCEGETDDSMIADIFDIAFGDPAVRNGVDAFICGQDSGTPHAHRLDQPVDAVDLDAVAASERSIHDDDQGAEKVCKCLA